MAWRAYNDGTKRTQYSTVPTSSFTAQSVVVDGVAVSNCDHAGITATQSRQFTSTGMTLTQTDGRGNATTMAADKLGRTLTVTDAAGNVTSTKPPTAVRGIRQQQSCCPQGEPPGRNRWGGGESTYCVDSDTPSCNTNAQGKETHDRYDVRGRKAADGCKADWTHAQRAPRRGEGAMERARINQTKVQTSTGIWNVSYNAENRPTIFIRENEDGTQTRITCAYDYMGRRARKKVETIAADSTATVNENRLFIYRGYLQIACCGLMETSQPCRWFLIWDPTQSPRRPVGGLDNSGAVAPEGRGRNGVRPSQPETTRPLAIRKDGTWYCYGWDLTKNICEVFGADDLIKTAYSYTPYGAVTASGTVSQPIQWSSEFYDDELGLVYYNYRHYNSADGRWVGRDPLGEYSDVNLYVYVNNHVLLASDYLGQLSGSDVMKHISSYLSSLGGKPTSVSSYTRIGVWPVPPAPFITIEAYVALYGDLVLCCKNKSQLGLMFSGYVGIEVNGGVGTSIGGTTNVKAEKGKNGIRYRAGKNNALGQRAGTFAKSPTAKNYGETPATATNSRGFQVSSQIEPCKTELSLFFEIGVSGFISEGVGSFSVGAQFDTRLGECSIPSGCTFKNPLKSTDAGIVTGLGSGARIQVYGRAGVNATYAL